MANLLKKAFRKSALIFLNNVPVNRFMIMIGKDHFISNVISYWQNVKFSSEKSLQENVGCSHHPDIQNLTDQTHVVLKEKLAAVLRPGDHILDIGSGTGIYLHDFAGAGYRLHGVDLNPTFIEAARKFVPEASFSMGNYVNVPLDQKFKAVYLMNVAMCFPPNQIKALFKKVWNELEEGGVFFFQYSHALSKKDLQYPDLTYVRYSPAFISRISAPYFDVLEHHHFFDDRTVNDYDRNFYYYPNGKNDRVDTLQNTYLFIGQKKAS